MTKRIFWFFLVFYLQTGTVSAADDPFAGKWKLNTALSKVSDQMKVKAVGLNRYDFNFSGDNIETIVVDGSDQPGLFGTTLSVTAEGVDTWKVVRKKNGRTTIIGIWKLSDNDKILSDNFTGYQADGSTFHLDYVYHRTAGASGFSGTWQSAVTQASTSYEIQIQPFEVDGLSFVYPASNMNKSMRFDGKDYPGSGPNLPQGYTSSANRINESTMEMTDKVNGKLIDTQRIELSPDRKTLTLTVSNPGKDRPNILVFDRE